MAEEKPLPNFQTLLRKKLFRFMTARLKTVGAKSKAFTARRFNFAQKYNRKNRFNIKSNLASKVLSKRTGFQRIYQNLHKRYIDRPQQQFMHADLMNKGKESIWKSMDMVFPTGGTAAAAPQVAQPQTESYKPFQQLEGGGMIIPRMEVDPVYLEQKRTAALRSAAPKKPVIPPSARVHSRAEEISPGMGNQTSQVNISEIGQSAVPPEIVALPESLPVVEEAPAAPVEAPVEQVTTSAPVTPPAGKAENPLVEPADTRPHLPATPPAAARVPSVQRLPEKAAPPLPPPPPVSRTEGHAETPRIRSVAPAPASLPAKNVPPTAKPVRRMTAAPVPASKVPVLQGIPPLEKQVVEPEELPAPPAPVKVAVEPETPATNPMPARQPVVAPEPARDAEVTYQKTIPAPVLEPPAAPARKEPKALEIKPSPVRSTEPVLPLRPEKPAVRRMTAKPPQAPKEPGQPVETPPVQNVPAMPGAAVEKKALPEYQPAKSPLRIPAEKVTIPERRPPTTPAPVPQKETRLSERPALPAELTGSGQKTATRKVAAPFVPDVPPETAPGPKAMLEPTSVDLAAPAQPEINPAEVVQPKLPASSVPFPVVRASRAAKVRLARRPTLRKTPVRPIPTQGPSRQAGEQPTPRSDKPVAPHFKARTEPYPAMAHRKSAVRRAPVTVSPKPALPELPHSLPPVEASPRRITARPVSGQPIPGTPPSPMPVHSLVSPALPASVQNEQPAQSIEKPQQAGSARQAVWNAPAGPGQIPARPMPAEVGPVAPAEQPARPQSAGVQRMLARPVITSKLAPASSSQPKSESVQLPAPLLLRLAVPPHPMGQVQASQNLSQQVKQKYTSGIAKSAGLPAALPTPAPVSAGTVQRLVETKKTTPKPAIPMPVVRAQRAPEVSGVVQRMLDQPGVAVPEPASETPPPAGEEQQNQPPGLNFNEIADQVYPIVIRRLEIEKERHAGKFW